MHHDHQSIVGLHNEQLSGVVLLQARGFLLDSVTYQIWSFWTFSQKAWKESLWSEEEEGRSSPSTPESSCTLVFLHLHEMGLVACRGRQVHTKCNLQCNVTM